MKRQRRALPWTLIVLGAALALAALGMLSRVPRALQYCVIAPELDEKGEALKKLSESARAVGEGLGDAARWCALGGEGGAVSLSADGTSAEADLWTMGEGWLEVYPRFLVKGRRVGESELAQGARVAMLDDGLAFKLFGGELPEDARIKIGEAEFQVVGTVRHAGSLFGGRGVGDGTEYDVYVPLAAAAKCGLPVRLLALSALPGDGAGAAQLFEEAARDKWLAGGELIDLDKEAMRGTILLRTVLLVAALYALVGLYRRMTRLAAGWIAGFRRALEVSYMSRLVGRLAGIVVLTLAGYAALIGLTWLLLSFAARPLYVFTEFVPESIVEWSSICRTFWSLTQSAASPVRLATRELRVLRFWSATLRWGTACALLGVGLMGVGKGRGGRGMAGGPS